MILGLEIGLLVYGLYAFAAGKYSIGKGRTVVGTPARLLGMLLWLPLPLAFIARIVLGGLAFALTGTELPFWIAACMEITLLISVVVAASVLSRRAYAQQSLAQMES